MSIGTKEEIRKKFPRVTPIRYYKLKHKYHGNYYHKLNKFYIHKMRKLFPNVHLTDKYHDFSYNSISKIPKIPSDCILLDISTNKIQDKDYTIMKIGEKHNDGYHVSIILINHITKQAEWFDTGSLKGTEYDNIKFFLQYHLIGYDIRIVNNDHWIQEADKDHYCQSWIYYYIYQRLYKNKTSDEIINKIMSRDAKKRMDIIFNFFHKIST